MAKKRFRDAETRYRKELQRNRLAQPGRHRLVLVLNQLKAGFNVANILRSAEVFGVSAVHLVGIGSFDPSPAKGALRKVPVKLRDEFSVSHAELRDARSLSENKGRSEKPEV